MAKKEKILHKAEKYGLNLEQMKFCELYASDREFFGNGVESYIEAYDPDRDGNWYNSAKASASRLLTNANVLTYINEILELHGLNDSFVDKQLELLVTQNADFKSKLGAIREYNALKARVTKKIDHTTGGQPIPIYGGASISIQGHDSNEEGLQAA